MVDSDLISNMPKTKSTSLPSSAACGIGIIPTESPVPGLQIELANLLVNAVKARRKFISKSSSVSEDDGTEQLQKIDNTANDKTTSFLNELKRRVQNPKRTGARHKSSTSSSNAPTKCLDFLLEVLSNNTNSFHLRRSALVILREILDRSSDARAYLSSGLLLNFVSAVENAQDDNSTAESGHGGSLNSLSPKSLFQLEAMELIHHLASQYGHFYTQFTVASRLIGDASINFAIQRSNNIAQSNHQSQRDTMRLLRKERDNALEYGPKACQSLKRMIGKADEYFSVLVPRMGGFNALSESTNDSTPDAKYDGIVDIDDKKDVEQDDDDADDDDSIDWEEGDTHLPTNAQPPSPQPHISIDHQDAVAHTIDIMGRSGALLDGKLAVPFTEEPIERTATTNSSTIDISATTESTTTQARRKLQILVQKLSTARLPRLLEWIDALTHADGMQERAVNDPTLSTSSSSSGPVSMVLISEEKRSLRGKLLQNMMRIKGEIENVLQSAATLDITADEKTNAAANCNISRELKAEDSATQRASTAETIETKRPPFSQTVQSKKKKPKTSRIKVIYKK